VALQVEASVDLADLGPQGVDAALRLGSGEWKGVRSMRLLDEYYYPVASPEFVREYGPKDPTHLLRLPLIRHSGSLGGGASWSEFFAALQLSGKTPLRSITFDDGNLALRAAEQGMGIAFARHNLVAQDIRDGRLVRLFDCGLRGAYATYFVSELRPTNAPGVEAMYQWLLEQARRCSAASEREFAGVRWLA
jgi:LysR family glycine cleavage system transcriptional activator